MNRSRVELVMFAELSSRLRALLSSSSFIDSLGSRVVEVTGAGCLESNQAVKAW